MEIENHRPKIYDCFMFFNEIDLLKIRLEELYTYVDYFIITESNRKFSGERKPLFFKKHKKEFEKFKDKIIYIPVKTPELSLLDKFYSWIERKVKFTNFFVVLGFLIPIGRWKNDFFQRSEISRGLAACKNRDIIFLSDLDEIPDIKLFPLIKKTCREGKLVTLRQKDYRYFINGESKNIWLGTKAIEFENLKKYYYGNPAQIRCGLTYALRKKLRLKPEVVFIDNGGWHFSFLGGVKTIMEKIRASSHVENDTDKINNEENIKRCLDKGIIPWDENQKINYVKIDKTFPRAIYENQEKIKHLIKEKKK